jgi:hypothetical protein
MMNTADFYDSITPFKDFHEILNPQHYHQAPEDWYVIIADIKGSTKAIRDGRYKDVNVIGASSIIAVINALGSYTKIPFVFGGDGASFLAPTELITPLTQALQGTREMAKKSFDLDLRCGIIPVSEITKTGKKINIAKYAISEHLSIAMFSGGGLQEADNLIKANEKKFDIKNHIGDTNYEADFSGLECRWNPIKPQKGEMLTLLVQAQNEAVASEFYPKLLDEIENIYGTKENYRPNNKETLTLSLKSKDLRQELGVKTTGKGSLERLKYAIKIRFKAILGTFFFAFDITTKDFEGVKYKQDAIANTDFQKFDDALRMVIDSSIDQTSRLKSFLKEQRQEGSCFYGIHIADKALMTCLIFDRIGKHLHFIDGADGGYAYAAKDMKAQMRL